MGTFTILTRLDGKHGIDPLQIASLEHHHPTPVTLRTIGVLSWGRPYRSYVEQPTTDTPLPTEAPTHGLPTAKEARIAYIAATTVTKTKLAPSLLAIRTRLLSGKLDGAQQQLAELGRYVADTLLPKARSYAEAVGSNNDKQTPRASRRLTKRQRRQREARRIRAATANIVGFAELGALPSTPFAEVTECLEAIDRNLRQLESRGNSVALDQIDHVEAHLAHYIENRARTAYVALVPLPQLLRESLTAAIQSETRKGRKTTNAHLKEISRVVNRVFTPQVDALLDMLNHARAVRERPGFEHLLSRDFDDVLRLGDRAHDANNATTPVTGYAEMLALPPQNPSDRASMFEHVEAGVETTANILSRTDTQSANLERVVEELAPKSLHLVKGSPGGTPLTMKVEFQTRLSKQHLWLQGGHTAWKRVLRNLFKNAKLWGGADTVVVEAVKLPGDALVVTVSDNGNADSQTSPGALRTTQPEVKSNGFGLKSVRRLVGEFPGTLTVHQSGEGWVVEILVPPRPADAPTSA